MTPEHAPEQATAASPVHKCLRVIVTAVYADGTSVVHDIPEPASVGAIVPVPDPKAEG